MLIAIVILSLGPANNQRNLPAQPLQCNRQNNRLGTRSAAPPAGAMR
jgi:hypothetical protein